MRFRSRKIILQIGIVVILAVILLVVAFWQSAPPKNLEVNFFDVGHGDAIFIRTPSDKRILIDGGLSSQIVHKLGRSLPFYDRRIDLAILTHPHPDHITGLISAVKRYNIAKIFYTDVKNNEELFFIFKDLIDQAQIEQVKVDGAFVQNIDSDTTLYFLYPDHDLTKDNVEEKDINNTSVVVKLIYKNSSFLFVGDAGENEEEKLLTQGQNLDIDILKVGHHGSATSSGQKFIDAVSPKIAVVTCGENYQLSHPSLRVLRRLERAGTKIYRTDLESDINVSTSGDGQYQVTTSP